MRFLRDLPIKRKLLCVTLATCGAALALACGALFWFQSVNFRRSFVAELESLGAVVAQNCAAPLAFGDKKSAIEVLSALKVKPHITSACIFDEQGGLFARFGMEVDPGEALRARPAGQVTFEQGNAHLGLSIAVQDGAPGRLQLRARFSDQYRELLSLYGIVLAAVLAGSLAVILIVSSAMQRIITGPIAALAEVARNVSEKEDYATRAPEASRDEVGLLTRAFNQMLDQIQSRDTSLRKSEERFRAVAENLGDGLLLTDLDDHVLDVNPRLLEMTGHTRGELIGRRGFEILLSPDQVDEMKRRNTERAQGRSAHYEILISRRDGSRFWVEITGAPVRDPHGSIFGTVGVIRDITARKAAEAEVARLNNELLDTSRRAGMAEIATSVLHNVGNVLNSVNVSAAVVMDQLRKSRTASLAKVVQLLREHRDDVGEFLSTDAKGKQLPAFLETLSDQLAREQATLATEMEGLQQNIEHINQIVSMQQSHATVAGALENAAPHELVEVALRMSSTVLAPSQIEVVRQFEAVPLVLVDRHKVLQILINLVKNAEHALEARSTGRRLVLRIACGEGEGVRVEVTDNGVGIPPENLTRIFQQGFTTKKEGHGFGLHSSALAAKEMGGNLSVHSDGVGTGARFTLELPIGRSLQAAA